MTEPVSRLANPPLFHVALRLDGERCLVVGGGPVGARKADALLECGAAVTLVSPVVSPSVTALASDRPSPGQAFSGRLRVLRRKYQAGDLAGCRLVVAATGLSEVDRQVFEDARALGVLVNAADDPEACEFLVPAVFRQGPVSIAVSTGGVSPYLASWLRRRLGAVIGPEVADLAEIVGAVRGSLRGAGRSSTGADWDELVDGTLWPLLLTGRREEALQAAEEWLTAELERLPGTDLALLLRE
ncbi:MAG: precorrin-2 dehydrogenase/sirohydrochlorin ferrochelatase family protein [Acidimicrobiales bacterium]